MNTCVLLQFIFWSPNSQGNGSKRAYLWDLIGSQSVLADAINAPQNLRHSNNVLLISQTVDSHQLTKPHQIKSRVGLWAFKTMRNKCLAFCKSHKYTEISYSDPNRLNEPNRLRLRYFIMLLVSKWTVLTQHVKINDSLLWKHVTKITKELISHIHQV